MLLTSMSMTWRHVSYMFLIVLMNYGMLPLDVFVDVDGVFMTPNVVESRASPENNMSLKI